MGRKLVHKHMFKVHKHISVEHNLNIPLPPQGHVTLFSMLYQSADMDPIEQNENNVLNEFFIDWNGTLKL